MEKYKESIYNNYKNNLVQKFFEIIPIFYPGNIIKIIWDAVVLFASLIIIFVLTVRVSFGRDDMIISNVYIFLILMIQVCDMVVSMNTGYYLKG